jgi:flagellin-like protein
MRLKKIKQKKAVSPIIATMLLIGIVIVLAIIIFLWLKGFTKEVVTKNLGFGEKNIELVCEDVVMDAKYETLGSNDKIIYISNNGNAPIYAIKIKKYSIDNTYEIEEVTYSDGSKVNIKQGKTISLTIGAGKQLDLTDINKIIILPVLLGNSDSGGTKEYICDEKYGKEIVLS